MSRFILLCLISFSAYAQTTVQPPPTSSVPWFGIALAIVLVLFCAFAIIWYRRNGGAEFVQSAMSLAESEVSNLTRKAEQPPAAAPAPAAPAAVPAQTAVAPVAPSAGTVTLPATGHVLPLARSWDIHPDGESFAGYALRVYKQCGATDAQAAGTGDLVAGGNTEYYFRNFGGYQKDGSNWPQAADAYYNPAPYLTSAERDYAAALLARDQAASSKVFSGPIPVGSLSFDDKMYLYWAAEHGANNIHYELLSGTSLEIRQVISEIGNGHTAEASAYDPATYTGPLRGLVEGRMAGR